MNLTGPLQRVLRAFLEDPAAPRYGYDLMKAAKLPSGTLYPMLSRLQEQGLVTSEWETPAEEGQRPRRYYKLTAAGVSTARMELAEASVRSREHGRRAGAPARGAEAF